MRSARRWASSLLAVASLVSAVAATAASLVGQVDAGVVPTAAGDRVGVVSTTGFAWRAGVRPDQVVISAPDAAAVGGWRLVTEGNGQRHVAEATQYDAALRDTLAVSLFAMLSGGLAVVFLRAHRQWVAAAACIGLIAAGPAIDILGKPESSTFVMGAAVVAPLTWLAWRPRLPAILSAALSLVVLALVAAWTVAGLSGLVYYEALQTIRDASAFWGTVAVVGLSVVLPMVREGVTPITRPRVADILLVAGTAGLALGLVVAVSIPPVVVGVVLLAVILLVPAWRRWFASGAERALLADLREQVSLEAAEAERASLARELHDVPLQQLAGVIRRLELIPSARAEGDALRAVADQLRGVATELRPPVLDDLGLGAALEFLGEAASTPDLPISVEIDDRTSPDPAARPPGGVELAMFRVAQEAVTNAIRHAQASEVRVTARVAADDVSLAITDDGRGLSDDVARAAGRRGHLGLASIRRRAEVIDADLSIEGSPAGTRVALRWQR